MWCEGELDAASCVDLLTVEPIKMAVEFGCLSAQIMESAKGRSPEKNSR